ncbi:MAG: hypothetical protein MUO40_04265 [Anaerolineaceae bacterium]|nr:hypothetical protein [Anaerolineaceae bacterium]
MKRNANKLLVIIIIIGLFLTSCNIPFSRGPQVGPGVNTEDQAKTMVALTMASISEPVSQETPQEPTQTATLQPTETPTNTLTPTNEPARVKVSVDTNCRTGPAKIFDYVGALLVGETADVVGKSSEGDYWIIKNPDAAGNCWLWGQYATVTGSTTNLIVYTPPPTPTPLFTWNGTWTTWSGSIGGPFTQYPMTINTNGTNFSATMDLGGGNSVNLAGVMDERHSSAAGSWTSPGSSGSFEFFGLGSNQFQGNFTSIISPGTTYAWCGGRGGAVQPNPCYTP